MKKNLIWTQSQARLKQVRSNDKQNYNWLFLPGGPGLGSESLSELTHILDLPGTMWLVDFPEDGSNISETDNRSFSNWQPALIEACSEFDNTILVAHSSGGMFALATPALEKKLVGLVLMDSAPNADWQKYFMDYVNAHPIDGIQELQNLYNENPSNNLLKKVTIACASYFSIEENIPKMVSMLESLPFNYKSHQWSEKKFDQSYEAKWIPKKIPTLIFSGDQDPITPLKLFLENKNFDLENIKIEEIQNASHFPWMDNPQQVKKLFEKYLQILGAQ